MSDEPKPTRPPRTAEERKHWGEMKPVKYGDTPGKRLGGWLAGLLTPWKR